jgi:hypothetical protein
MKEAALSNKVCLELRYNGKFCYKTSDRFHAGLPDIYIEGGNWIETKVIKCSEYVDASRLPRPEQRNFARNLIDAGDLVYLLVGIEFSTGVGYWLESFPFEETRVTSEDCCLSLSKAIKGLCNSLDSR